MLYLYEFYISENIIMLLLQIAQCISEARCVLVNVKAPLLMFTSNVDR